MKILINIIRLVIGGTLLISGFVKAIDPLGTQYKLQDYLAALGLSAFAPDWLTLLTSVALSAAEFTLGVLITLAISRRLVSLLTLIFLVAMTLITVWLYIGNPVSDCGCFGDAFHLTNGQSLLKNIILMALALLLAWKPREMVRFLSDDNSSIVFSYSLLFIVIFSVYSLYTLPQFDFRPYHVGVNIWHDMQIPRGAPKAKYKTTFLLTKNGETREFTLDNYPDSTWTFVDSKTITLSEGYQPPIHDFSIEAPETSADITRKVLTHPGYTFLLISPSLEKASDSNFGSIEQIYEYAKEYHYPFYCLTASGDKAISHWQDITGAEYPFCHTDPTTLKTVIRSNPGLLLLHNGTIIQKWSHNNLPSQSELSAPLSKLDIGHITEPNDIMKIFRTLLFFFVPLVLLILADRTFAIAKWLRIRKLKPIISNKQTV